jgi:hypothetical protein
MPDWITLLIEAVGVLILCIWIVIPVQEFKSIFARLRREGHPTLADPHRDHLHKSGEDA